MHVRSSHATPLKMPCRDQVERQHLARKVQACLWMLSPTSLPLDWQVCSVSKDTREGPA